MTDRHVAVAAAADPIHAAPLIATYRGSDVQAELTAQIRVEAMDEVAVPAAEF